MRLRILNDWRHRSWNDKRFGKIDFICTAQEILTVLNGFQYIHHIKSIIINYKGLILKCLIKFLELRQLANERSQNWTRIVAYQNGVRTTDILYIYRQYVRTNVMRYYVCTVYVKCHNSAFFVVVQIHVWLYFCRTFDKKYIWSFYSCLHTLFSKLNLTRIT